MRKITILFLLLSSFVMQAQAPSWAWAKTTGDSANNFGKNIAVDGSGNVYMTGNFTTSALTFGSINLARVGNGTNIYIVKYSPAGEPLWAKAYGMGLGSYDESWDVAADAAGNAYITGNFRSTSLNFGGVTLTTPVNTTSAFVAKLDAEGNVVWARSGAGTGATIDTRGVAVDGQGNVFMGGYYSSGGTITFGNITLTNPSNANLFLVKYDASGTVVWVHTPNAPSGQNRVLDVCTDAEGNSYITGYYSASQPLTIGAFQLPVTEGYNMLVVKYDSLGNVVWATAPTTDDHSFGYSVDVDADGRVVVGGSFNGTTLNFGNVSVTNTTTNGNPDIYVAQFDTSGNSVWAKKAGGIGYDAGYRVASDAEGNVYLNGYFESQTATFGGITLTKSNNYSPISFVAKYSENGDELWALHVEETTTGSTSVNGGIDTDAEGNIYVTGSAYDDVAFGNITIEDGGIFLAKLSDDTAGIKNFGKNTFKVYPNPVSNVLTINGLDDILSVGVYNALGQKMMQIDNSNTVDMSSLQTGWYIVEVVSDKGIANYKVIKN